MSNEPQMVWVCPFRRSKKTRQRALSVCLVIQVEELVERSCCNIRWQHVIPDTRYDANQLRWKRRPSSSRWRHADRYMCTTHERPLSSSHIRSKSSDTTFLRYCSFHLELVNLNIYNDDQDCPAGAIDGDGLRSLLGSARRNDEICATTGAFHANSHERRAIHL